MITPTAVYLMKNDWSQANYKVGISNRPARREVEIQENYGVYTVLLATCWFPSKEEAQRAEHRWHQYLEEHQTDDHSGKEWFSLTTRQVEEFKKWARASAKADEMKRMFFSHGSRSTPVRSLVRQLFSSIPRQKNCPRIDVWHPN